MSENTETETILLVETPESDAPSFAVELAKTLTTSAAATAGTLVGMVAVGFAVDKVQKIRASRASKKAELSVVETETAPTEA